MASLRTALLVSLCLLALLGGLPAPVWAVKARPNTRDASVWARGVAKNAKTRLLEGKAVRIFRLATATVLLLPGVGIGLPGTPRRIVFMFVLMIGAFVQHLRTRRPYVRPPLHGQIRTMGTHSFSNETCREFLGYDNLVLLQRALNAWQIPASITVGRSGQICRCREPVTAIVRRRSALPSGIKSKRAPKALGAKAP